MIPCCVERKKKLVCFFSGNYHRLHAIGSEIFRSMMCDVCFCHENVCVYRITEENSETGFVFLYVFFCCLLSISFHVFNFVPFTLIQWTDVDLCRESEIKNKVKQQQKHHADHTFWGIQLIFFFLFRCEIDIPRTHQTITIVHAHRNRRVFLHIFAI